MKILKLIVVVSLSFLITSCNAQRSNPKTDLEKINAFGKVKSIKGFIHRTDENVSSKKIQMHIMYDKKGNKKEIHWYDNAQNISSKDFYKYDRINNIILMERYELDTILKMKSITKLNSQGYELEKIIYRQDGSKLKTYNFKYNDNGYNTEMVYIIHYASGDDYSKWKYEYDSNGYLIIAKRFNKDGSLDFKQTSKNDKNGNELEWIRYENDGTLDFRIDREFDKYGNEIKYHMHGGSIDDKDIYKYTFDSKNNWLEKQHFNNGKKIKVEIREIIYYK